MVEEVLSDIYKNMYMNIDMIHLRKDRCIIWEK